MNAFFRIAICSSNRNRSIVYHDKKRMLLTRERHTARGEVKPIYAKRLLYAYLKRKNCSY